MGTGWEFWKEEWRIMRVWRKSLDRTNSIGGEYFGGSVTCHDFWHSWLCGAVGEAQGMPVTRDQGMGSRVL